MFSRNKILRHPRSLAEWMETGHPERPIGMDIHLTDKCPHKCPQCNGHRRDDEMSVESAKRIIQELEPKAVHWVGGGEPLAHPKAAEAIQWADDHGISNALITNLWRVTDSQIESLRNTCTWIRVSLDASTPEQYRRSHGVDTFDVTMENIGRLCKANGKAVVGVGYLTTEQSKWDVAFLRRLEDMGISYVQFRPYNGTAWDWSDQIAAAQHHMTTMRLTTTKYVPQTFTKCHGCHFWVICKANGTLISCCERVESVELGPGSRKTWCEAGNLIDSIDVTQCPPNCRMGQNNTLLEQIAEPLEHEQHI